MLTSILELNQYFILVFSMGKIDWCQDILQTPEYLVSVIIWLLNSKWKLFLTFEIRNLQEKKPPVILIHPHVFWYNYEWINVYLHIYMFLNYKVINFLKMSNLK